MTTPAPVLYCLYIPDETPDPREIPNPNGGFHRAETQPFPGAERYVHAPLETETEMPMSNENLNKWSQRDELVQAESLDEISREGLVDMLEESEELRETQAATIAMQVRRIAELRNILDVILDQIDYTSGACRVNEMIGAVLEKQLIINARVILERVSK